MSPLLCMLIIFIAGGLGGIVNALLNGEGLLLPYWKSGIWCPGFVGNMFIGSIAAMISWGLNSAANLEILDLTTIVDFTVGNITSAVLVGVSGTRWLSSEVDKKILRQAASEAGKRDIPPDDCNKIQEAPPMRALQLAQSYPSSQRAQTNCSGNCITEYLDDGPKE